MRLRCLLVVVFDHRQHVQDYLFATFVQSIDQSDNFELHACSALLAGRELLIFQKCHFMWEPVLLVANFIDAARKNLLSGKIETHRHGSPLQLFRGEQVRYETEWLGTCDAKGRSSSWRKLELLLWNPE
jgi:hypothetical protein